MKTLQIFILFILALLACNNAKAEDPPYYFCCDSLSITTAMTDSCCLVVTLNNPECFEPDVYFYQWNSSTNSFDIMYIEHDAGASITYVFCPMNDDDFIKFQIKVHQSNNSPNPMCHYGDNQFVEGYTQFTDSIDVSYCCECPTNVNGWLTLAVEKDETNCPGGCKVTPILDIPDNITCYRYYSVAIGEGYLTPIRPISQLSTEWVCVEYNETVEYIIVLLQRDDIEVEEEYDNLCKIEKTSESCDSCPCPPDASSWLHVVVEKDAAECPNGCQVAMELNIPEEYDCYEYYILTMPDNTALPIKSILNNPIREQTFCMDENTSGYIKVALMKNPLPSASDTCNIYYPVECDSTTIDPDSLISHCYDNCNEEWEVQPVFQFELMSGCTVYVEYETRTKCPPDDYQDIHILKVSRDYSCSEGIPLKELFSIAFRRLVQDNPMGFEPFYPPWDPICYDTWRLFDTQCKMNLTSIGMDGNIIFTQVACPGEPCCVRRFEVCRDSNGIVTITPYGGYITPASSNCIWIPDSLLFLPPSLASISITPTFPMTTCIVDCDSSKIEWDNPAHQKIGFQNEQNNKYEYHSDGNTFYFNCYDSYPCDYIIEIFDPVGRSIFAYEGVTSSAKNAIDIRNHVIDKGVYLYKVRVNGTLIGTGKIIK